MSGAGHAVVVEAADRLWRAAVDRVPIGPITEERQDLTVEDAYAIQAYNVERRIAEGGVVRGRKAGSTSRATQELLGVDEPSSGVLLDDMFVEAGDEISLDALVAPRVEAEMTFVMATDLAGPGITTTDALTAIGGVLPAIQILDSRIRDWRIQLVDAVADNVSAGRVVLGGRVTSVKALDLRLVATLFSRNGVPIASGAGAAVLGHPARCVAWLANRLGALGGGLRGGDIVLPGALHRMVPVRPGDHFEAEFAHLGSVTAQFSNGGGSP